MAGKKEKDECFGESRDRAFQLLTISRFILARTPMILGYAKHNELITKLSEMTGQISFGTADVNKIVESQEWKKIQKILGI